MDAAPYMVVVPGSALFQPWTLVTSVFVETTIFEVCQKFGRSVIMFLILVLSVHRLPTFCPRFTEIFGETVGKY